VPQATFLVLSPNGPLTHLPFKLEQQSSRVSAILRLVLLVPALIGVFLPVGLVAAHASDVAIAAQARPMAAAQIATATIIWLLLFGMPTFGILRRFGLRRTVHVDQTFVAISEIGPFIRWGTTRALSEFCGIAHVTRTSLSGTRHELLLVDAHGSNHVIFHASERIDAATVMSASECLGLPELAARDISRWSPLST
jgi:hypothetical protein